MAVASTLVSTDSAGAGAGTGSGAGAGAGAGAGSGAGAGAGAGGLLATASSFELPPQPQTTRETREAAVTRRTVVARFPRGSSRFAPRQIHFPRCNMTHVPTPRTAADLADGEAVRRISSRRKHK